MLLIFSIPISFTFALIQILITKRTNVENTLVEKAKRPIGRSKKQVNFFAKCMKLVFIKEVIDIAQHCHICLTTAMTTVNRLLIPGG